jgi:hypothetical protein
MGIIVLPLTFAIAVVWLGVMLAIAFAVVHFVRKLRYGTVLSVLIFPLVLYLGWWLSTYPGRHAQERMNSVARQCGWTAYKQVKGVEGIFVESEYAKEFAEELLNTYEAVEYLSTPRVASSATSGAYHLERSKSGDRKLSKQYLERRTFRYGVRRSREMVAYDIQREEMLVWDFDAQQAIGQRVQYEFLDNSSPSFIGYALGILFYHPSPCGYTNPAQTDIRTELPKILVPK